MQGTCSIRTSAGTSFPPGSSVGASFRPGSSVYCLYIQQRWSASRKPCLLWVLSLHLLLQHLVVPVGESITNWCCHRNSSLLQLVSYSENYHSTHTTLPLFSLHLKMPPLVTINTLTSVPRSPRSPGFPVFPKIPFAPFNPGTPILPISPFAPCAINRKAHRKWKLNVSCCGV